jgi:3-oxoacyl-[acyl-carrier-protein] synthase III
MTAIVAIGTSVPEFVATNEHVISLALECSEGKYSGSLHELELHLRSFLEKAGSKERRWRAGFSKPSEHIFDAWTNCQSNAGHESAKKIGALIYCGIDRGVAEPSHASLLARRLGLYDVRCLDISDACMGWFTAAEVATKFTTIDRPYCVIVSAEFPLEMPGKVYPRSFAIKDGDDLSWKGAALTMGEAASVTIIDASAPSQKVFRSNNRHADICCVPLTKPERFVDSARLLSKLSDDCFVAHMPTMASATYRDSQSVLETYIRENGLPDIVLPHTVSQSGPAHASKHLLQDGTVKNCFEYFGNLATSSIPIGYEYFDCVDKQDLHIAAWISAAGMSHCAVRLSGSRGKGGSERAGQ